MEMCQQFSLILGQDICLFAEKEDVVVTTVENPSNTFLAAGNKREWTSHACTTIVDNRRLIEMTEKELNFSHFSGKSFPFDSSINQFKNREIRSREEGITRETVEDGSRMFEAGWCSLF